jgi:hypothetical protein
MRGVMLEQIKMRMKRKKGGQPGNQNARTHGFFSSSMSPEEVSEFWKTIKTGDGGGEYAAFRVKLYAALRAAPSNRRIIQEASRLMTKWICSQNPGASRAEKADAAKVIRFACSQLGELSSKTNEAETPEMVEFFTKRFVSAMEKCL